MLRPSACPHDPFALSLSKGAHPVVSVLRQAQDERGFVFEGRRSGLAGLAGVAERCVLLGPSTGSGRAGFGLRGGAADSVAARI